jgi:amino acid adenylation domain-containing protein
VDNQLDPIGSERFNVPIGDRFASVVAAHSKRCALQTNGGAWSYQQLDDASNRITALVDSSRESRDTPVALLLETSRELFACMLAIVKVGRVFVCLDPNGPISSSSAILANCGAQTLLTNQRNAQQAAQIANDEIRVVEIGEAETTTPISVADSIDPGSPYCILYTTGSTGQPKGVLRSHTGLLLQIQHYSNVLDLTERDRVVMLSSPTFGAASSVIFGALLNGACLLPFDILNRGLTDFKEFMRDQAITVLHTTPSLFRLFTRQINDPSDLPDLRIVKLGGETAFRADAELFRRLFPPMCQLVNGLGITETSGNLCYYKLQRDTPIETSTIPIGYPVEHKTITILDDNGNPQERGKPGEIAVTSKYLSPGYWRNQERTAKSFESVNGDGFVRFRTGDIGLQHQDGCIEHLGRKDRMIKLRGYRVELNAVEAALTQNADVAEAVVLSSDEVDPDSAASTMLLAWLVPTPGKSLSLTEIRRELSNVLPHYMVPSKLMIVDALPLKRTGKIDRQALQKSLLGLETPLPPAEATATERELIELLLSIVDIRPIKQTTNLSQTGMTSLDAMSFLTAIEAKYGHRMSSENLFQTPSIAQLAQQLRTSKKPEKERTGRVYIARPGTNKPLFLLPGFGANLLDCRDLINCLHPSQSVISCQFPRKMMSASPIRIESLAEQFVSLLIEHDPDGPYLLAGYSSGGLIVFEMARLLRKQGRQVAFLGIIDTATKKRNWMSRAAQQVAAHRMQIAELPNAGKLKYASAVLKRVVLKNLPRHRPAPDSEPGTATNDNWDHKLQQLLREASHRFRPKPYGGRVTLFRAAERRPLEFAPRDLGWGKFTEGVLDLYSVPGDHWTMLTFPHVEQLSELLQTCIHRERVSGQ